MRRAWLLMVLVGAGVVWMGGVPPLAAQEAPVTGRPAKAATNRALLQSEAWHETMHEFDEWASVQKLYTPQQIKKFRAQIVDKASTLTGEDLEGFLEDLNEKLRILSSSEAREARKWLSKTLAVASDSYAEKVKAKYSDMAGLTASQLQERLDEFQDDRASARRSSADFAKARQAQVEMVQAERERQEEANVRAQTTGSYSGYHPGYGSSYDNSAGTVERYRAAYPMFWGGFRW